MIQFGDIRLHKARKKPLVQALCDLHGVNYKTSQKFVNYGRLTGFEPVTTTTTKWGSTAEL